MQSPPSLFPNVTIFLFISHFHFHFPERDNTNRAIYQCLASRLLEAWV
jgi:hypothetical protein